MSKKQETRLLGAIVRMQDPIDSDEVVELLQRAAICSDDHGWPDDETRTAMVRALVKLYEVVCDEASDVKYPTNADRACFFYVDSFRSTYAPEMSDAEAYEAACTPEWCDAQAPIWLIRIAGAADGSYYRTLGEIARKEHTKKV